MSSSRVYADSQTPITENSPRLLDVYKEEEYLKTDEYALSKARQEDILHRSGKIIGQLFVRILHIVKFVCN